MIWRPRTVIKLATVATGQAEVRLLTHAAPDVAPRGAWAGSSVDKVDAGSPRTPTGCNSRRSTPARLPSTTSPTNPTRSKNDHHRKRHGAR